MIAPLLLTCSVQACGRAAHASRPCPTALSKGAGRRPHRRGDDRQQTVSPASSRPRRTARPRWWPRVSNPISPRVSRNARAHARTIESPLCCATCSPGSCRRWCSSGLWYFVIRRMAEAPAAAGWAASWRSARAAPRSYVETDTGVTFADVAGVDEAKARPARSCGRLPPAPAGVRPAGRAHPEGHPAGRPARHRQDAAAKAVAGEAGVPLVLRSRAASSSRCSLASARRACATCSSRRAPSAGHHLHRRARCVRPRAWRLPPASAGDEKGETLNQLLVEMDGFDPAGLIILAATNRPESSTPRCCAPGALRPPGAGGSSRSQGARDPEKHSAKVKLAQDAKLDEGGRHHPAGFSGADLANLVNGRPSRRRAATRRK